jgi:hypothetical protein
MKLCPTAADTNPKRALTTNVSFRAYSSGLIFRASKNYASSALPKGLVASAAASRILSRTYSSSRSALCTPNSLALVSDYRELLSGMLSNSSDCKAQLSKRRILPDPGTDG